MPCLPPAGIAGRVQEREQARSVEVQLLHSGASAGLQGDAMVCPCLPVSASILGSECCQP